MERYVTTNLAYLRFKRGQISQKAVSEATGIGQKTLSALETGASKGIEFNTLIRLCEFFECSPSDLLVIAEEPADYAVSERSRTRAKELVAQGLEAALNASPMSPEDVWARFDAVRLRMQEDLGTTAKNVPSAKKQRSKKRA